MKVLSWGWFIALIATAATWHWREAFIVADTVVHFAAIIIVSGWAFGHICPKPGGLRFWRSKSSE